MGIPPCSAIGFTATLVDRTLRASAVHKIESRLSENMFLCLIVTGGLNPIVLLLLNHPMSTCKGMITDEQSIALVIGNALVMVAACFGKLLKSYWQTGLICVAVSLSFGVAFGFTHASSLLESPL